MAMRPIEAALRHRLRKLGSNCGQTSVNGPESFGHFSMVFGDNTLPKVSVRAYYRSRSGSRRKPMLADNLPLRRARYWLQGYRAIRFCTALEPDDHVVNFASFQGKGHAQAVVANGVHPAAQLFR